MAATSSGQVTQVEARRFVVDGLVVEEELPSGPVVRLTMGEVPVTRAELVAALFNLSWLTEEALTAMSDEEVRRYAAGILLDSGRGVVMAGVDSLAAGGAAGSAFLELCERRVDEAFGFDVAMSAAGLAAVA